MMENMLRRKFDERQCYYSPWRRVVWPAITEGVVTVARAKLEIETFEPNFHHENRSILRKPKEQTLRTLLVDFANLSKEVYDTAFSSDEPLPPHRVEAFFLRDDPGYEIDIHPDVPSKIFTMSTYLALPDDGGRNLGLNIHGGDVNEKLGQVPYEPGSTYAFKRADNTFHSVDRVEEGEVRYQLMVLWLKEEPDVAAP